MFTEGGASSGLSPPQCSRPAGPQLLCWPHWGQMIPEVPCLPTCFYKTLLLLNELEPVSVFCKQELWVTQSPYPAPGLESRGSGNFQAHGPVPYTHILSD